LPELGKGLGEGIRGLKDGIKDRPSPHASSEQSTLEEASHARIAS